MAISTYAELQAAIASWLARDDLTSNIPDFIMLFEAEAARRLRVRPMETSATLTPTSGVAALPSDYLGHRRLTWQGSSVVELDYVPPVYLQALYPSAPAGSPSHFTIEGGNILVRPTDDTDLVLEYFAKNTSVSSSLNWLFTNHPDAYLYGSLAEAAGFIQDTPNEARFITRRDAIFDGISKVDFRERANMSVRVVGATP